MAESKQAVATGADDPNSQGDAGAKDGDALADLDALLAKAGEGSQGDGDGSQQDPQKGDADADRIAALERQLEQLQQDKAAEAANRDIKGAVTRVRESLGDGAEGVSDKLIRGLIEAEAAENPLLREAFEARTENPKAWDKAIEVFATVAKAELMVDPGATAGRRAVASAMGGASTTAATGAESQPNLKSLSDEEFAKKAAEYGL